MEFEKTYFRVFLTLSNILEYFFLYCLLYICIYIYIYIYIYIGFLTSVA